MAAKKDVVAGYQKVDEIVRAAIADRGFVTLHPYLRYLHWALDAIRDWNQDGGVEVKKEWLDVTNRKTVAFPDDFLGWCRMGLIAGDRILVLTHDSNINLAAAPKKEDANDRYIADIVATGQGFSSVTFDTLGINNIYSKDAGILSGIGWGHNDRGYIKVNYSCGEFQLSSEYPDPKMYLEWISDGFDPTTETIVNKVASRLIRLWIHWQEAWNELGAAARETVAKEQSYLVEFDNVQARLSDLSYEGIQNVLARTTSPNPRM